MELIDVINEVGEITKTVPIDDIYSQCLPHRIIHILIFNDKGEMALQKRGPDESFCPDHWSTAVGGHVQAGETPTEAARREVCEELGVSIPFEPAFTTRYDDMLNRGLWKELTIFTAHYNGPFTVDGTEVVDIQFLSLPTIHQMIQAGDKFHPELKFLLTNHFPQPQPVFV